MAKSGRLELGDNIYGYYKSIFNHCDVFGQQSNQIRWKMQKRLLCRSRSFKVIEVGTNRKPICDFLLVINSNWQPLVTLQSYHSLLFKFWTLCVLEPPFGGLGTTYDVHLGLIGKHVMDFLLGIIQLFSLDVTAEVLRAKIDRKSAILLQRGQFDPKFQVERMSTTNNFCMDS